MRSFRPLFAAALGLGAAAGSPAFEPAEGSRAEKAFEVSIALELEGLSLIVDGQDMGAMLGALALAGGARASIEVTDTYAEIEGGRPLRLERSFDRLEATLEGSYESTSGNGSVEAELESLLEGAAVAFVLDADGDEYRAERLDDGDESLVDGLLEDMDLRTLLPEGTVEVGDSWSASVAGLRAVLLPGGDLAFEGDGDVDLEDVPFDRDALLERLTDDLRDNLEGAVECTLVALDDAAGTPVARIEVEVELASAVDLAGILEELLAAVAEERGEELPLELDVADLDLALEGVGRLAWDLEAGRFASFELATEGFLVVDLALTANEGAGGQSLDASLEASVATSCVAEAE